MSNKNQNYNNKSFYALQSSLWGTQLLDFIVDINEYMKLMQEAERQTILGLMCDVIIKNNVILESDDVVETIGLQNQIEKQNRVVNRELIFFAKELDMEGINYIIVKGQTMAVLYPNPLARMPGDVDIYFPGDDFKKVKEYVEKTEGINLKKYSDGKHVEFTRNGVILELHDTLSQFANYNHQRYFDKVIDDVIMSQEATVTIDNYPVKTLPPTYNILYTFIHLFFHMTTQGIGLRQFCDLAVLIGYTDTKEIDKCILDKHLCALGLQKAFNAVGAVLIKYLGLPKENFPFELNSKDYRWAVKIIKNVMYRGNFGNNKRHVNKPGLLHSMESGWIIIRQACTFLLLAPAEVSLRFFSIGNWFMTRLALNN